MRGPSPFLEVEGVSKAFPGVQALDSVSLDVEAGEIHALVGENGAGKSTLIHVLGGLERADAGEIRLAGTKVAFRSAQDAIAVGIGLIHQELQLAPDLSVAENLLLGCQPTRGWLGLRDRRALRAAARRALDEVDLDVEPGTPLARLSTGRRQLVEIARALLWKPRLLILDEPTSALSAKEVDVLFCRTEELRRQGIAILYVSHRLDEIERLADRVTVLRDGRNAGSLTRSRIDREAIVRLMVGRDVESRRRSSRAGEGADARFRVRELRFDGGAEPVSLAVQAGEILGLAGLVGSGRTALLHALFGLGSIRGGTVEVDGRRPGLRTPLDAMAAGLLLVPEDRQEQGVVLGLPVEANLTLAVLPGLACAGLRRFGRERRSAAAQLRTLDIRARSPSASVAELSGGNQQKVALGKWLALGGRVLLLDEPTRGVDIAAKHEIYAILDSLLAEGLSIVMASSDMEELLLLSDRVLVMRHGSVVGELPGGCRDEEVLRLALGTAGGAAA